VVCWDVFVPDVWQVRTFHWLTFMTDKSALMLKIMFFIGNAKQTPSKMSDIWEICTLASKSHDFCKINCFGKVHLSLVTLACLCYILKDWEFSPQLAIFIRNKTSTRKVGFSAGLRKIWPKNDPGQKSPSRPLAHQHRRALLRTGGRCTCALCCPPHETLLFTSKQFAVVQIACPALLL